MEWIEISIKTKRENEDYISHLLYELGVKGLSIEDSEDIIELAKDPSKWDFFGINLENLDQEHIYIRAYFSENEDIEKVLAQLENKLGKKEEKDRLGQISKKTIDEKDWADSWKQYYRKTKIGNKIIVKPSWEEYNSVDNELIIDIDPGMAFGTGTHESTILSIEALEEFLIKDSLVFDIGCGSGILSVVAAKLGASKVIAVDIDSNAISASQENIKRNNLENFVDIRQGNLLEIVDERAQLIVSNIIAEVIIEMLSQIGPSLEKDGLLIASGIIKEKEKLLRESLEKNDFEIIKIKKMNEWISIISKKIR